MAQEKKDKLFITTSVSGKANDQINKFQAHYLIKKGVKIKKMEALEIMLETYKVEEFS